MERDVVNSVAFWVGAIMILALFGALTYRFGKFTLMPGEPKRIAAYGLLFLALGTVLAVGVPVAARSLGQSLQLTLVIVTIGLFAFSQWYSRRQRGRVAEAMAKHSPEVQAEYARRKAFVGSRHGWGLTLGMLACIFIWSLVTAFTRAP